MSRASKFTPGSCRHRPRMADDPWRLREGRDRLLELFPQAEIFTSIYDPRPWPPLITERPVHASFLNRIPRREPHLSEAASADEPRVRVVRPDGFDLVLSSNHSCAKNVLAPADALHVCYCHTPMRHAWEPRFLEDEWAGPSAPCSGRCSPRLRRQDLAASSRPDDFVANSTPRRGSDRALLPARRAGHPPAGRRRAAARAGAVRRRLLPRTSAGSSRTSAPTWRSPRASGSGAGWSWPAAGGRPTVCARLAGPAHGVPGRGLRRGASRPPGGCPGAALPRRGGLRHRAGGGPGRGHAGHRLRRRRRSATA